MKNFILGVLVTVAVMAAFGFINEKSESDVPDKEWKISPRFLTLQDGVSKEEARVWLENEYLPLYRQFPGWNAMAGETGQSGGWGTSNNNLKEKADFVLIYFFDSIEATELYFDEDGMTETLKNGIAKHQSTFDELFGKYFIQEKYQMEGYNMFARAK